MSDAQELFGRVIEVTAGIQGEEGFRIVALPTTEDSRGSLRVDFHAQYKPDGKPSKAQAIIYNPPDRMIHDLLEGERAFLSISAGYLGRFGEVFTGSPVRKGTEVTRTSGGDIKLVIAAVSGGSRYRTAAVRLSRSGRPRVKDIAEEVVTQAGWTMGRNEIDPALVYTRGFSVAGAGSEAVAAVARRGRVDVSMAGDTVHLLDPVLDTRAGVRVAKFSARPDRRNLIGDVTKTDKGLRFRGLLEANMLPGDQAVLEYFDFGKGAWVTTRVILVEVTYRGSNYARDHFIEGVGRPLRS